MIRASFTVGYRLHRVHYTVLGVTSIVPNLNGFLFFTEDGENHFVESHELLENSLTGIYFEYSTEEDIEVERELAAEGQTIILDHRKH